MGAARGLSNGSCEPTHAALRSKSPPCSWQPCYKALRLIIFTVQHFVCAHRLTPDARAAYETAINEPLLLGGCTLAAAGSAGVVRRSPEVWVSAGLYCTTTTGLPRSCGFSLTSTWRV